MKPDTVYFELKAKDNHSPGHGATKTELKLLNQIYFVDTDRQSRADFLIQTQCHTSSDVFVSDLIVTSS